MLYFWFKILHIVFVASWFAGLFYLPRIFVNMAAETHPQTLERLTLMAQKLYRFMHIIAVPALIFGLVLMIHFQIKGSWLHIKLALVLLALAYHFYCGKILSQFIHKQNHRSHVWFRWFNEIPVLLMLAITALVVIKPVLF